MVFSRWLFLPEMASQRLRTTQRSRYAIRIFMLCHANSVDLHDHSLRRTNRTPTCMDHICYARPRDLSRLRCTILESSSERAICFQARKTEEARERTSIRSTCWNLLPRAESVYLQGVHSKHAAKNKTSGI